MDNRSTSTLGGVQTRGAAERDSRDIQVRTESGEIVSWEDLKGYEFELDGTEDIQPSFPIIKIVQGTSTMTGAGKHGGEFHHSDTDQYDSVLNVVALVRRQTRALFQKDDSAPLCMSTDGIAPMPRMKLWERESFMTQKGYDQGVPEFDTDQPATCALCPFSAWDGDQPPLCGLSDVLLLEREDGTLAQLRVGGKSIKPLKQFIARQMKPKKLPLYAFALELSTQERNEPGKHWYELVISGTLMSPKQAQVYSDRLRAERSRFEKTLEGQAEWTDEATPPPDDGFEES